MRKRRLNMRRIYTVCIVSIIFFGIIIYNLETDHIKSPLVRTVSAVTHLSEESIYGAIKSVCDSCVGDDNNTKYKDSIFVSKKREDTLDLSVHVNYTESGTLNRNSTDMEGEENTVQNEFAREPTDGKPVSLDNSRRVYKKRTKKRRTAWLQTLEYRNSSKVYDIMNMKPINFLPTFANPCWYGLENNGPIHDGKLHCLPYFYIIGVKKCGTTDLFSRIAGHPDFIVPGFKEAQWFARRRFGNSSESGGSDKKYVGYYITMFDKAALKIRDRTSPKHKGIDHPKITAEASPSNLHKNSHWEELPGNNNSVEPRYATLHYIKHLVPKAKLIITIRDPVERLLSDYLHGFRRGRPTVDKFHETVVGMIDIFQTCFRIHSMRRCLYNNTILDTIYLKFNNEMAFQASFYAFYMKEIWSVFPKEQVMPIFMLDYIKDMKPTLKKIFSFLNLRPLSSSHLDKICKKKIAGARKRKIGPMLEATKKILYEFFSPYNLEMAKLMNDSRYTFPYPNEELN